MSVRVRFAPSPTGSLHIGSARTALFNYLFARHNKGKFLLRIEDTDRLRSSKEAVDTIFNSLDWLGLKCDEEPVFQFERAGRHAEVAYEMLKNGYAYKCFSSQAELEQMREDAKLKGLSPKYNRVWRDRSDHPNEAPFVIRLKAPLNGETVLNDLVQGTVRVNNEQLDDMVLLRADGTPTYMLSVVVDDHDMNISHVIRGDDHLTNTFRQIQIYKACSWNIPEFAHIPLIHGQDGAKLSKRHGAVGTEYYKDLGVLPKALRNYLTRLGWAHGDDEIFSDEKAIEWFSLDAMGKSPSRFDVAKLLNLNAHYIRESSFEELLCYLPKIKEFDRIKKGIESLKVRAKTINELYESMMFYEKRIAPQDDKAKSFCTDEIKSHIRNIVLNETLTEQALKDYSLSNGLKFSNIAQGIRVALTGKTVSPSIFEIMEILGKEETLARLDIFCS